MPPVLFKKLFQFTLFGLLLASCSPSSNFSPIEPIETLNAGADLPISPAEPTLFIADIDNFTFSTAAIEIVSPGGGSQLSSPILLEARLEPGPDGLVRIELVDGRGRLLARKILDAGNDSDDKIEMQVPIYFEISAAALEARLLISVEDEFDRLRALNSVEIVISSLGQSSLLTPADLQENIIIELPPEGETVEGGHLVIRGQARSQPGRPLNVQLIRRNGRVLAFGEVYPVFEESNEYGTFQLELDYSLDETEWVLIAISEANNEIIIHYASVEVLLAP